MMALPATLETLLARAAAYPSLRTIARQWLLWRDVTIPAGVARGLRFNAGRSDPFYALGVNERPVQDALKAHLRAGDVFYDIGANVGFLSLVGARLVGSEGRVEAFEPVPENLAVLRQNVVMNDLENRVTVHALAVSRTSGRCMLNLAGYSGGSSLAEEGTPPPDLKGSLEVDTISVDELIFRRGLPAPRLVKIDVEGAEQSVMEGMTKTLDRLKPVLLYEIDDETLSGFYQKSNACGGFLKARGYTLTRLADAYPVGRWKVAHFLAIPG